MNSKLILAFALAAAIVWPLGCTEDDDEDYVGGVSLWEAIRGKTTPEYEEAVRCSEEKKERLLRNRLSYLYDIPEVDWIRFEDNNVYVGFNRWPNDGLMIIKGAAIQGNEAINFGCHVWGVPANQRNNPPYYGTMSGKWYNEATARYGQIQ